jgi:hypothetical protein
LKAQYEERLKELKKRAIKIAIKKNETGYSKLAHFMSHKSILNFKKEKRCKSQALELETENIEHEEEALAKDL